MHARARRTSAIEAQGTAQCFEPASASSRSDASSRSPRPDTARAKFSVAIRRPRNPICGMLMPPSQLPHGHAPPSAPAGPPAWNSVDVMAPAQRSN